MDGDESRADGADRKPPGKPSRVELLVQSPNPRNRVGSREDEKRLLAQEFETALESVANCELVPGSVSLSAQTIAAFTDTASLSAVQTEIEAKGFRVYQVTDQRLH